MTHICVSDLTSIGSDDGLSPGQRQAIIWTNAGILSNIFIHENAIESVVCEMAAILSRPQCVNRKTLKVQTGPITAQANKTLCYI